MADSRLQPLGAYTDLQQLLATRSAAAGLSLERRQRAQSVLAGGHRSRFRGRGMEFAEVRPYQPGDDVRSIDWRVTARTQKPYTKLYTEERQRPVFFLIDQRAAMFFGSRQCFKSVYAAHLAATLSWVVSAHGDRVGGMFAHARGLEDHRARGSQHAALALINRLHTLNHTLQSPHSHPEEPKLRQWFSDARRAIKPGASLIVISDFHDWDEDSEKALGLLARHNDLLLFHIYDALERQWPADAALRIHGRGTTHALTPAHADALSARWQRRQDRIASFCQRPGAHYFLLDTRQSAQAFLLQQFGPGRRR